MKPRHLLIALILLVAPAFVEAACPTGSWDGCIVFRGTAGYVSDPANCTHYLQTDIAGAGTPITRSTANGCSVTFNWHSGSGGLLGSFDQNATVNTQLAGNAFTNTLHNASGPEFDETVPAAGTYNLYIAIGRSDSSALCSTPGDTCTYKFYDGSPAGTLLLTLNVSNVLPLTFVDATGTNHSAATWGSNSPVSVTLATTTLAIVTSETGSSPEYTTLTYLEMQQTGGSTPTSSGRAIIF